MKKIDKKDLLCCTLLTIIFIAFVLIITHNKFYYGSTLDWESQHSVIPDMFRMMFYKTRDLFPDFAFNLGNGQNIYNFAYYGLLSPITIISYLLPFIKMVDYVQISSIASVIISAIMFYFFERKNNNRSYLISFLISFVFMFATSMTLHSHRHIMFVNYMPFLIMGLFGVDLYFKKNKGYLLALSVFLIVMSSFYYSISSIISLILFGVYRYISDHDKITFKKFIIDGFKYCIPILIGVASSAIIILPLFYVILHNRGAISVSLNLKDILMPGVNLSYFLYGSYGLGLTSIVILAMISNFFKKKEYKFLSIALSIMIAFPVVNYILNATMYIDSKILIPMLPLALLSIDSFLSDLLDDKTNFKRVYSVVIALAVLMLFRIDTVAKVYFLDLTILSIFILMYKKTKHKSLLIIPIIVLPLVVSLGVSFDDALVNRKVETKVQENMSEVFKTITENDDGMYRISNETTILRDVNNLYGNLDYKTSTLYSSTYDLGYNRFYYDTANNQVQNRNRVITSASANLLWLMFSGNKYLVTRKNPYYGYQRIDSVGKMNIYKNEDVLPIAYARSDVMSYNDFKKLDYPYSMEALLKKVVVGDDVEVNTLSSNIKKIELNENYLDDIRLTGASIDKKEDYLEIDVKEKAKTKIPLDDELKGKILFIRFDVLESASCSNGDMSIYIAGVENKLTCKSWKYHNGNYKFDYTIARQNLDELEVILTKGKYKIANVELYTLDYSTIMGVKDEVDEFVFDEEKTRGDVIEGSIDVTNDGYFVTSIPYDKGFNILVDGQKIESTKVNETFLGFKISKGHHSIRMEYKAPLKNAGLLVSLMGIISFGIYTFSQRKN